MEDDVAKRLDALERKMDAIFASAEQTRKYFLAVLVISAIAFILPLFGLLFAIPSFMSTYSQLGDITQF